VQGVEYYRDADPEQSVPGLMHVVLGGYHVGDVEFVTAFDVDAAKVGLDVGKAIFAGPNNTISFADVPELGVLVQRAPTLDGLGKYYRRHGRGVAGRGRRRRRPRCAPHAADVLVSYLPVGSEKASEALRPGLPPRRCGLRERDPRVHRQQPRVGAEVHRRRRPDRGVTTSRARSARRSSTASSRASSRTGVWCSTARTS